MSRPLYGRYQAPEPPSTLSCLHLHDGVTPLKVVDHEPRLSVLDQSDLLSQGINTDELVIGAVRVDGLGSCTANAAEVGLSNLLDPKRFEGEVGVYTDSVTGEKWAIVFYHQCTFQTGDPGQEWPPTDCGSSGPYIVSELQRLGLVSNAAVASGAQNIVSLLQKDGVLMGSPWLNAWETPDNGGFIDGDGSSSTLQTQIAGGVAGGHETYLCAIERIALDRTGHVLPSETVIRGRNSWSGSWGDHGDYRVHLSTLVALGNQCDFRQLQR